MLANYTNTTLYRVQPLLFTVFGISACHNLFFLLLPLQLHASGHDTGHIGLAMSFFALGAMFSGLFGAKFIGFVGHIRTFTLMSAVLVAISGFHSFYDSIWLTGLLRALGGFALVTSFITIESWLNVITDQSNRARTFSIYQICVGIGGASAPFVLNSFEINDPRLFGVIGVFLAFSSMVMSVTRLPNPTISTNTAPLSLKELWNTSPSGTTSCFCAGLIISVSISLITIYATERALEDWSLSLVLSSVVLGGFLTQYPTGWFADRFDKRTVASVLMVIGTIANGAIIFDAYWNLPLSLLSLAFLISGGAAAALFPLAVTQVFDHIDSNDAVRATGTLQIVLGLGGFVGPIIAGTVMEHFGAIYLFYYIGAVHIFVILFLLGRRIFIRQERLEPSFPFQVAATTGAMCKTGLDPRIEYKVSDVGDPTIKLLLLALEQGPADPTTLIQSALENSYLQPMDIAVHLVLAVPKNSDQLIGILVSLFPEKRMDITQSLFDLILLRKRRINALVKDGLCHGANAEERADIIQMIEFAFDRVESDLATD